MEPVRILDVIAGTTLRATWINSSVTPSSLNSALLDPNEAVVNTYAAASSGNGHYYAVHHIPASYPWYVNRWIAFIEGNTYQHRQLVRARKLEV